jgi:hypothetical protein
MMTNLFSPSEAFEIEEQKALLIYSYGYTIQDGEIRNYSGKEMSRMVATYISRLNITKDEKIALAEQCGFEVVNGRIKY